MSPLAGLAAGDPPGATPLDDEDLAGLIPLAITTRGELNAVEQANVLAAMTWAFGRRRRWRLADLLTRDALGGLHKRMFGDVWRWAGQWRQRDTNLGVWPRQIPVELEHLLGDVRAQTADPQRPSWPPDEIAVRFHHRLVLIHPFANGNGRHARLVADLTAVALGRPRFTWGSSGANLTEASAARATYIAALRLADHDFDYGPLIAFARS